MTPPSISAPPRAVLFDAYGTLFDVYSVGTLAERLFPGHGEPLTQLWRGKQIEYSHLCSMSHRYRPFWDLTRAGLRYAAERLKLELSDSAQSALMDQYLRLSAFPENLGVLQALRERRIRAGVLSNGDPAMLRAVVDSAGFGDLLDPLLSAQSVQRFKTDEAVYALGPQALGVAAGETLFVSSNAWDAVGATWYGYTTLWVNRAGLPLESLDTEPTRIGSSLRDVLGFFD
jgi:2-haloacid dehalogenase